MTLHDLNAADETVARAALSRCCGSTKWVDQMMARRPFSNREELLTAADSLWSHLSATDWLEAFSSHPKIGGKKTTDWSSQEQSGVDSASTQMLDQIARGNQEYEQRFGWIFLINATGKTASQMLDLLHARLKNEATEELQIAAAEQAKITKLRLNKLMEE